jgi:hypothetical protein
MWMGYCVGVSEMKVCPKCSKSKIDSEYYILRRKDGDTLTYWCKECIEYYIKHTSVRAN